MSAGWRSRRSPLVALGRSRSYPRGGAGFLLRWDVPRGAGSYGLSAGVLPLRPTGGEGKQVPRGVHVPVKHQTTVAARVGALGQGQLGLHLPTDRASLGRSVEAVSDDKRAAVPRGLVAQHPSGLPEFLV